MCPPFIFLKINPILSKENKKMKEDNLQEIYQFLLQKYQDDINRKERLENKALGYLTMLSVTLAVSTTVFIAILQSFNRNDGAFLLLILFFFGHIYFAIWTFIFSLKAYGKKTSYLPDYRTFINDWKIKKDKFLGGLNKALIEGAENNEKMLKKLLFDVDCSRIFLILSLCFGILVIGVFLKYLLDAICI
jgi:hypothetical protein